MYRLTISLSGLDSGGAAARSGKGEEPGEVAGEAERLGVVAISGRWRPRSVVEREDPPPPHETAPMVRLMATTAQSAVRCRLPADAVVESFSGTVPKDSPVTAP